MANKLTINFAAASPTPVSYRIKYWPTSDPTNITTITVPSSPAIIDNLTLCAYAGTIESFCASGAYSAPDSFAINICTLSYTPCVYQTDPTLDVPSEVRLAPGVQDIAPGVTLYDQNNNIVIGVIQIADSNGLVYTVNDGVVGAFTGNVC